MREIRKIRKNLISRKESFICLKCGQETTYKAGIERNHCPNCLYSLHVDLETPGDRQAACKSLMQPATVSIGKKSSYIITHLCLSCGKIIPNKAARDDNIEELIPLINANPKLAILP